MCVELTGANLYLFGTPSSNDVKVIRADLQLLRKGVNLLVNDTKILSSNLNISFATLQKHQIQLNSLRTAVDKLAHTVPKLIVQISKLDDSTKITALLLHVDYLLTIMQDGQNSLEAIHKNLMAIGRVITTGKVDPSIIPPESLEKILLDVRQHYHADLNFHFENFSVIWQIYRYNKAFVHIDKTEINIVMTIQLTDAISKGILTEAYTVPAVLNATVNKHSVAEYALDKKHLLVMGGFFAELTKSQFQHCKLASGRFCNDISIFHPINHHTSCLFALFSGIQKDINRFCSVNIRVVSLPFIRRLTNSQWHVQVAEDTELMIRCPLEISQATLQSPASILKLNPFCEAFSPDMKILATPSDLPPEEYNLILFHDHPYNVSDLNFDFLQQANNKALLVKLGRSVMINHLTAPDAKPSASRMTVPLHSQTIDPFIFDKDAPEIHWFDGIKRVFFIALASVVLLAILLIMAMSVPKLVNGCQRAKYCRKSTRDEVRVDQHGTDETYTDAYELSELDFRPPPPLPTLTMLTHMDEDRISTTTMPPASEIHVPTTNTNKHYFKDVLKRLHRLSLLNNN